MQKKNKKKTKKTPPPSSGQIWNHPQKFSPAKLQLLVTV
jgi:hypothetical protein